MPEMNQSCAAANTQRVEGEAPPEPIQVNAQKMEPQISRILADNPGCSDICVICGQNGFKFRIRAGTRSPLPHSS